jgi:O-methyltransferase
MGIVPLADVKLKSSNHNGKLSAGNVLRRLHRRYVGSFRSYMRFPTFSAAIYKEVKYSGDPVRYATVGLALERLRDENVQGDFAELGVWRGHTSSFLHLCSPDRVLHLFDTFSGFPTGATDDKPDRFANTNAEFVKQRLGGSSNVVLHIGRFPETAVGFESLRFAFVMLDADCYSSTLSGLEFFYPRTVRGGYIFLHDFNSPESNHGVSLAVSQFLSDKPEQIMEIPDTWGSVFFRRIAQV